MKWLLLFFAFPVFAEPDPSWRMRVLRSPHFELIYKEDQKDLARQYILAAERAHELLIPIFKEGPYKTIIFLQDDTDNSNGMAEFLPYPHITVYPVLPTTFDSVDEYGDWALEMMIHEYTHILNMYPAHSFYVPLKWVFGSVVRPNALLPRWYLEGLAVNLESWLSTHGRLRSSETRAAARALVLGNRLRGEDVSRINESGISQWPYGGRPYLFGGWWWEEAHRQKGVGVIETWNQNFSRRLPFLLNGPVLEQTQKSADEFMNVAADSLEIQGRQQIETIRAAGVPPARLVGEPTGEQTVFSLSPSATHLLFWRGIHNRGTEARLKTRNSPEEDFAALPSRRLFKSAGTLKARWLDEERFVFDQFDLDKPYVTYRDLFLYNLKTGRTERLTNGARAQEPAVKGERVVYIRNDSGRNHLELLELGSRESRTLVRGKLGHRLSGPEFLNDQEVVFAWRKRNGSESLYTYNLETRALKPFAAILTSAQNARVTPKGLLVTDAGTNVRNVYLLENGVARAVSNTLTDIQSADYDPVRNEILASELTSEGRRLMAFSLSTQNPPALAPSPLPPPPRPSISRVKVREENYLPIAYLWPRYWIPFIYQVEDGLIFQGITSNEDPAGRNRYALSASYDTVTNEPSYGMSYSNHSLPTSIGLGYAHSVSYLGASGLALESDSAALSFTQNWPFRTRRVQWSLGGLWDQTDNGVRGFKRLGPEASWVYSRLNHPLNERWGMHFELNHQQFLEQDGYMAYGRSYAFLATEFRIRGDHRLFFQARGAVAPDLPMNAVVTLGDRSLGGNYLVNLANSQFLLRGYPSGEFVGRRIVNGNLEYVFPAVHVDKGFGTFPLFLRGLELALFTDVLSVDGGGYDLDLETYKPSTLKEFYVGSGAELRVNTTTGYHLPLSVTVGLYYGHNERFGGGLTTFLGIGFGGISGLENKTP